MRDTSLLAYHNLNRYKVGSQNHKIYSFLQTNPSVAWSDTQIAFATKLSLHVVESRRSKMEKDDIITYAGDRKAPTGNFVRTYKVKQP